MASAGHIDAGKPPEDVKTYIREMLAELAALAEKEGDAILAERIRSVARQTRVSGRKLRETAE